MKTPRSAQTPKKLDDAARAAWLAYVAGKTQDEIARLLGVSRQSAQRLVSQAMQAGLVKVRIEDSVSETFNLLLNDYAPGVFDFRLGGATRTIATHADGRLITPDAPAAPGETIVVYGTGFGPVDVLQQNGVAAGASPLAQTLVRPQAFVGGREAAVVFAGLTPSFVGLYQANVTLPQSLPAGDLALRLRANGVESNETVLAVR